MLDYVAGLLSKGAITEATATAALRVWSVLNATLSGRLIVPNAGATPDGHLLFSWDRDHHHLEVEVSPDGVGEFFYLNYETDATWEYDYILGRHLPSEVADKLRLFAEGDNDDA